MMRNFCYLFLFMVLFAGCGSARSVALEDSLRNYINSKDAKIGVAVVIDGKLLAGMNEKDSFPMLSVFKFPLALTVAEKVRKSGRTFDDSLGVKASQLHADTWSPMLEKYPANSNHAITINELLDYSLRSSDNNACDILLDFVGGTSVVDSCLKAMGINDISVRWNEHDMNTVIARCYDNSSTPAVMAMLMYEFDGNFNDANSLRIKRMMESCGTGTDRLQKPFVATNAVVGHKTGTGPMDNGRIMAVNDAGYVHLPNGKRYAIAVFVAGSTYSMDETAKIIAKISEMVLRNVNGGI